MYKKQMKFQRLLCFMVLAAAALTFIYSLGIITDIYESLYFTIRDFEDPSSDKVAGARIFYDMQPFNKQLTTAALILIGCSLFVFINNTHSRRRYYIGNYVSIGISVVAKIVVAVWALPFISAFKTQYITTVDFEELAKYAKRWKTFYTDSTFWFDAGYVVCGILVVVSIFEIINLIWKIRLMKEERKLIKEGLED